MVGCKKQMRYLDIGRTIQLPENVAKVRRDYYWMFRRIATAAWQGRNRYLTEMA